MGRRHYDGCAGPRAVRSSVFNSTVVEDGPQTRWPVHATKRTRSDPHSSLFSAVSQAPEPKTPNRRHYPYFEPTSRGSTEDAIWMNSSRRHFRPQNSMEPPRTERKHLLDFEHLGTGTEDSPAGRRHVQPPEGHCFGAVPQVYHSGNRPPQRRHYSQARMRPSTAPPGRDAGLGGAQRHHFNPADHMWGPQVQTEPSAGRGGGLRCKSQPPSSGVALALRDDVRYPEPRHSCTSGRRHMRQKEKLIGGSLRMPSTPPDDGCGHPLRRTGTFHDNLLGHQFLSSHSQTSVPPTHCVSPKDNLVGARFRQASPHPRCNQRWVRTH